MTATSSSEAQPHDIVKVVGWVGIEKGSRYLLTEVKEVPASEWPRQAWLRLVEHWPSENYPLGWAGKLRVVPLECCRVDEKRTALWKEARV